MYNIIEILGTDKPVVRERESDQYFLEELSELNERIADYSICAYMQLSGKKNGYYKPLYARKGVKVNG